MLELWKTEWRWKKYQPRNSKHCGLVIYSIGAVGDWVLIAKIDKYENVKDAQRVITFDMTFSKIVIRRLGLRQIITLVRHKKARFNSKMHGPTHITGISPEAVKWGVDRYDRLLCPSLQPGPPSQTPGSLGQRYWSVSEVTWPPQLELRRWRSSGSSSVMKKSPVRHKNARSDTKMPSQACTSWHCHYQTSPPPFLWEIFFPILFQYFVFKNQ